MWEPSRHFKLHNANHQLNWSFITLARTSGSEIWKWMMKAPWDEEATGGTPYSLASTASSPFTTFIAWEGEGLGFSLFSNDGTVSRRSYNNLERSCFFKRICNTSFVFRTSWKDQCWARRNAPWQTTNMWNIKGVIGELKLSKRVFIHPLHPMCRYLISQCGLRLLRGKAFFILWLHERADFISSYGMYKSILLIILGKILFQ